MLLGGLQKLSLIDFPDKISCIVWVMPCNFRCPYCYNPDLVHAVAKPISETEFFKFLGTRKGLVDGVVVTGGEPLIQKDIEQFLNQIKKHGFLVKLDTNGSNPALLKRLTQAKLIDYIAMDIKAPHHRYQEVTEAEVDTNTLKQTITYIMGSGIDYEFRTTVVPGLVEKEDIVEIARNIKGAKKYVIQAYYPSETLDAKYANIKPHSSKQLKDMCDAAKPFVGNCSIR
ncbi:MAG: anaerobic ribonucleoside-triphosphate reductase activating protein [Candidatus Woesearchaeota archaeon]